MANYKTENTEYLIKDIPTLRIFRSNNFITKRNIPKAVRKRNLLGPICNSRHTEVIDFSNEWPKTIFSSKISRVDNARKKSFQTKSTSLAMPQNRHIEPLHTPDSRKGMDNPTPFSYRVKQE